jgi:hypothetical protein
MSTMTRRAAAGLLDAATALSLPRDCAAALKIEGA